tara:strand:+ start:632 stop:901 length:270 start_codon:yes stop_codon:yes gene_type:complete
MMESDVKEWQELIDYCRDKKTSSEILAMINEAKLNDAPYIVINKLQQLVDVKADIEENYHSKTGVVFSAWKNYCRQSWLYRLLEKIGLR